LLLGPAPTSLNSIITDFEISKSSASFAARLLEQYTPARRHGERGSQRALYEVS
jgi:DNA-binding transcriptional regulator GbsR (MarR family)